MSFVHWELDVSLLAKTKKRKNLMFGALLSSVNWNVMGHEKWNRQK